jgi:hypothetical protein
MVVACHVLVAASGRNVQLWSEGTKDLVAISRPSNNFKGFFRSSENFDAVASMVCELVFAE